MKPRERNLLVIALGLGISSLLYVFVVEPGLHTSAISGPLDHRNRKYLSLLQHRKEIQDRTRRVFAGNYWKNSLQEQQVTLQIALETLARESGISRIKSIYPLLSATRTNDYDEIVLQMNLDCSMGNLTRLLYKVGTSGVPLQVRKLQIIGETGDSETVQVQLEVKSLWMSGISG